MRYGILPLVCCVGLILGTPAAATDTTTITIDATVQYGFYGLFAHSGSFEATGDVADEGTAQGLVSFYMLWSEPVWRLTLTGDDGTLDVEMGYWNDTWKITGGTGDYADASGGGTYEAEWGPGPVPWFTASVTWTLSGTIDT
jgi:hypothetical protein